MTHLYLPITTLSIIIDLISVFVYFRIICNVESIDKDRKSSGLRRYILLPISRLLQVIYLYNIDSYAYADFSLLIDYILYFCIDIWIWNYYFQFNKKKRKRCRLISFISVSFIVLLSGTLIYDKSIIYDNFQTVRIIATIVNLSNFTIYLLTVKSDDFVKSYLNRVCNSRYCGLPKFYIKNTIIIMYLNIFVLTASYIIGGHNGRLIANIYTIFMNLYILNFWINNVIIDFTNYGAVKYKRMSAAKNASQTLIDNIDSDKNSSRKKQDRLFDEIIKSVHNVISEEKLYLNPDLRMQDLLIYVNTNRTYLSAAINNNDTNFTRLILRYRLCHFQKMLNENEDILISDAALESGFATSKILCRAFRQGLGTTPSSFRNMSREEQVILLKEKDLYIDKFLPFVTNL